MCTHCQNNKNDIVGSFLRPQVLKEAKEKYLKQEITREQLIEVENEEIRKLVEKQLEVGLKVVSDGEFRRAYWHLDFIWGFDGVEFGKNPIGYRFKNREDYITDSAVLTGKIKHSRHPFIDDWLFLKNVINGRAKAKLTVPAPAQFLTELSLHQSTYQIYQTREELIADIIQAYVDFIQALVKEGLTEIQFDDCTWSVGFDADFRKEVGIPDEIVPLILEGNLQLNNAVVEKVSIPVNTHFCRGNNQSDFIGVGPYDGVADTFLSKSKYQTFYLEYDDERSGDFKALAKVPKDKKIVLGLITSKFGKLEDPKQVIAKIHEAAQYHPLELLSLSTQCGFASTEEGNKITETDQWNKLRLIKEISEQVWGT